MDLCTGPREGRKLNSALAQTGRKLGPRALQARQRLLEAAADLLKQRSVLDISVAEIARRAEASPATFYHYFKDVEAVALVLAEQAADEMPWVIELMAGPWRRTTRNWSTSGRRAQISSRRAPSFWCKP